MRKVRYKTLRVDMGCVWVSLLLLLYLAPGAPGLGDKSNQNRPVTLQQLSLIPGQPPEDVPIGMVSPSAEAWRVRRSRVAGVRRIRRRTRSHYHEDPEPEDYEDDDEEGSANQVDEDEDEDAPEDDRLLLEHHVRVEEDDDDEAPPDSTEMRERYRVSEHENPPEPPTRPNYTGEGHWARPPAHVAERIPFVPVQNYAQVRRYETELHLSPEDAMSQAANQEEAENAPRLREVVTHHKTQQVYSEEGYEDSAYDHGGYDKHGEHHELAPGWEMTAVRLKGLASQSPPEPGSTEEEGGEGEDEEEDGEDHNAQGSDPRGKAVAAPDANRTRHGATDETRGTWSVQKVSTDDKNRVSVVEATGNFSKPTPDTPLEILPSVNLMKSKRNNGGRLKNSTLKHLTPEQLHVERLLRALKLKEKERRLSQKRSKKWGREKKKDRLKKEKIPSPDDFDIRDNEIKQPRSRKAKKLRKEQKRAKRMKASKIKGERKKSLKAPGLFDKGRHVYPSSIRAIIPSSSGVHLVKGSVYPHPVKKVPLSTTNKMNGGHLKDQNTPGAEAKNKHDRPLESTMKNPFSMYHRDPIEAMGPLVGLHGHGMDKVRRVLGPATVGDVAHSKIWDVVSPWGSYGNGRQQPPLQPQNQFQPLPIGLLASADSGEDVGNDGLATVLQPIRSNMEGFFDSAGRVGAWDGTQDLLPDEKVEKRGLSTTIKPKPKFIQPGLGNVSGKFPKTEAILQMETRTLSKLRKTHNVKEFPSNLKHVKPLIGVTSNKDGKLSPKQIKMMKDIGKRSHAPLYSVKNVLGLNRSIIPTAETTLNGSTEKTVVTTDRAIYIANLTENYLTMKNYSWPPQVSLSPQVEIIRPFQIPQIDSEKKISLERELYVSPENVPHKKTRRNASYRQGNPSRKTFSRGKVKFKRDNKPLSRREPGVFIDEKKYPFYFAAPSEHITRFSPLRYATNPWEIPVKTGGGMEFYESREKYKKCKEMQAPEDPVPDHSGDGKWVQNTDGPGGPRISGLGEVISCLREKLFGKEPLDNPFFLETKVGLPAETALVGSLVDEDGTPAPETTDQFDFYKDIMRQIDNTALRPLQDDVPDNPYVYIGSKSTSNYEGTQISPKRYRQPHFHHFNLHYAKEPETEYFDDEQDTTKEKLAAQFVPKDTGESEEQAQGLESHEQFVDITGRPLPEPALNQQYFNLPDPVHNLKRVDPHMPFKMTEESKKFLDDVLDGLATQRDSKEAVSGDRSQTDAQETTMRIAHSDTIYQPIKATKMQTPALTTFKYKSKYTDSLRPNIHLGPNSHEKFLSWPKAKYVLRDTGVIQEVFESAESKDPVRSKMESSPENNFHEQKKISTNEKVIHSHSYHLNKSLDSKEEAPVPHPSKTAEKAKQKHAATKDVQLTTEEPQPKSPTAKPEVESVTTEVHEPSASVITPLSTHHPPRLPEPIYHAVRGVGGIKTFHVGMQDDSVIEIPTLPPDGEHKPVEHTEGTELSAQQSDEREQQASNEPDPQEEQAPDDDAQNDNHDDDNDNTSDNKNDENKSGNNNDDNNASDPNKNDDNNASDPNKNDDQSEPNKNDENQSEPTKNEDDQSGPNNDDGPNDKQVEDDDAKDDDNNEETPNTNDDHEEEADKSKNNGKPDFDDWFKESPYKVNDENDYNVDWNDSRPKFRVPFSKEWHKELEGVNDEFKDDKEDDGVGKHVENLFDDDKDHDAYPDINTEPPPPASGEGDQGDGTEGQSQEAVQQEPQLEDSAHDSEGNAPSEEAQETNKAASPDKEGKDKGSATEETTEDAKKSPKEEEEDGSNEAKENLSPAEEEPKSSEEPTSAEKPKNLESGELPRRAKKKQPKYESAQEEAPSQESGGTGNDDGYDPAGYEKPGDEHNPSAEAHSGAEESQQNPKKTKALNSFWQDNDDFGAPPGAKIRVVEHDASFGDMDDFDDDDLNSHGGKKVTRLGKTPENLSITTTNSQVRSKGFDTGVNKRRATSHQNKAKPFVEHISTSSGEDMDGDFATYPKLVVPLPTLGNGTQSISTNQSIAKILPVFNKNY